MLITDQIQENEAVLVRVVELINQGKAAESVEFTHPDCTMNGEPYGRAADLLRMKMFETAFPDQAWTWDRLIIEGEWASAAYTFKGTFLGPMGEVPPNGKEVIFKGVSLYRIQDRQIMEIWEYYDKLSLYQQMGVIPI